MATVHKLKQLAQQHKSIHGSSGPIIDALVHEIGSSILKLLDIIQNDTGIECNDLESHLVGISRFFREENFSKTIIPVLEVISQDELHKDFWLKSRYPRTKMPITPHIFEDLPKSQPESKDDWNQIIPAVREREKLFLSIYEITMERIGEVFLQNNKHR